MSICPQLQTKKEPPAALDSLDSPSTSGHTYSKQPRSQTTASGLPELEVCEKIAVRLRDRKLWRRYAASLPHQLRDVAHSGPGQNQLQCVSFLLSLPPLLSIDKFQTPEANQSGLRSGSRPQPRARPLKCNCRGEPTMVRQGLAAAAGEFAGSTRRR